MKKTTLAMIVGTRDFFPAEPVLAARREVIALLAAKGVDVVIPDEAADATWAQSRPGRTRRSGPPTSGPTATSSTAC